MFESLAQNQGTSAYARQTQGARKEEIKDIKATTL